MSEPSKRLSINVPQLTNRVISNRVEELLSDPDYAGKYPVDIEKIIERHLKLSIIPVVDLKKFHGIDAYITSGFTIVVDEAQYAQNSVRYRFSVAHELAHYILHAEIYNLLKIEDIRSHVQIQNQIPPEAIKTIEMQAYRFAGCLLLPESTFSPLVYELFSKDNLKNMSISDASYAIEKLASDFNVSKEVIQRQLQIFYRDVFGDLFKILY